MNRPIGRQSKIATTDHLMIANCQVGYVTCDGGGKKTWSTYSKNGNKTAKNNVKNFHGRLATVVSTQNDTSKTANIN